MNYRQLHTEMNKVAHAITWKLDIASRKDPAIVERAEKQLGEIVNELHKLSALIDKELSE